LTITPAVNTLVRQASRPTLARLLGPARATYPRRGATTTHPSTWLKQQIPIRTFMDWDDARPGFCQVDLVAHCGGSTKGFYLHTLCAVDVATSWVELQALWGKGHYQVAAGVQAARELLPAGRKARHEAPGGRAGPPRVRPGPDAVPTRLRGGRAIASQASRARRALSPPQSARAPARPRSGARAALEAGRGRSTPGNGGRQQSG